ncbi:hypothetical protein FGO68_gene1705 [Halteria grandinella]|uniref:Uncharacterized protein n=1 Tax=Halteria grandinella TaxID=5974 RepID=A0A8J8NHA8_HALGN|nr:hypothetical protein FGO68_gene1705 [Halteria grandinella]
MYNNNHIKINNSLIINNHTNINNPIINTLLNPKIMDGVNDIQIIMNQSNQETSPEYIFKFIMVGNQSTGKTSMLQYFIKQTCKICSQY